MVYEGDEGKYAIILEKTNYYKEFDWYIVRVTKFNRAIIRQDRYKIRTMLRVMHTRHLLVDEIKTEEKGRKEIPANPQQFLLAEDISRYAIRDRQIFHGRKVLPDRPGKGILRQRVSRLRRYPAKR